MRSLLFTFALVLVAAPGHTESTAPARGDTLGRIVPLPEIVVSTTRASERMPIAHSVIRRAQIQSLNWGQDTPMALATLPGVYVYSDAGNGVGYSYLSIRGFPQRRISVLVNGVPLNDPESHEVYWIDHPDLLASTSEAQVQRGVGSALYGAASLGGSVDLETSPFAGSPRTAASLAYGSWETKRLMLEMASGPLSGGWNLYGRYSRIESFGYRDQSWSKLWSYYLSAQRRLGSQSFRLNLYGGPEETHLAYNGVPAEYMDGLVTGDRDRDRRFNPLTYKNERDHFFEPHYELQHSWSPHPGFAFTQTLFYFDGKGYYDEQRFAKKLTDYRLTPWSTEDSLLVPPGYYSLTHWVHTTPSDSFQVADRDPATGKFVVTRFDLVRRRTVANRHYGWVPRLRVEHTGGALTIGGEIRAHDGRHWGELVSGSALPPGTGPDYRFYDYHPRTLAGGLFAREEWSVAPQLLVTGDMAWRHQAYFMRGDQFDGIRFDQPYDFALPRLGLTWSPRQDLTAFTSWAYSAREPAFRDLYDAEYTGNLPLYRRVDVARGIYQDPLIRPEKVNDLEAGASWRARFAAATVNLFRMDFRDELVYAGQFNTDLGYAILGNAARSIHQGVELALRAEARLAHGLGGEIEANATMSDNHFVDYREIWGTAPGDTIRYDGKALGLFPAMIANLAARARWKEATLGLELQQAGRIYVDNTEDILKSVGPHTVLNLTGGLGLPVGGTSRVEISLRVNNLLDQRYAATGYIDGDTFLPVFIPAATRNWLTQVRVEF